MTTTHIFVKYRITYFFDASSGVEQNCIIKIADMQMKEFDLKTIGDHIRDKVIQYNERISRKPTLWSIEDITPFTISI